MIEIHQRTECANRQPIVSDASLDSPGTLLTGRRIYHYSWILLILSYGAYVSALIAGDFPFDIFGHPFAVDFTAKLTAGRIAIEGNLNQLYQSDFQWQIQQAMLGHRDPNFLNLFIAPAVGAWLYAPLAFLPYFPAAMIWTVVSVALFGAAFRAVWPLVPRLHEFGYRKVLLIAFSAPPVVECVQSGQDSLLSLFMIVVSARWLLGGKDMAGGAMIGLGMYKLQLFIFFPVVLIAQRRWAALVSYAVTASVLAGISILSTGFAGIEQYAGLLTSEEYSLGIADAGAWHMMSISALIRGHVPLEARPLADGLLLACGAVGTYVLARRARQSSSSGHRLDARVLASVVLITGLSIPHFFSYDCTILLFPALILLNERWSDRRIHVVLASLYLTLFATLPLHVLASSSAGAFGWVDTQWAVIPMIALLWLAWKPGAVDPQTKSHHQRPGLRRLPGNRESRAVAAG